MGSVNDEIQLQVEKKNNKNYTKAKQITKVEKKTENE